jgi:hypothetical protein
MGFIGENLRRAKGLRYIYIYIYSIVVLLLLRGLNRYKE